MKLAVPLLLAVPAILIAGSTPSNIALSSSPNPSVFGHPTTLTAVVAPPTASGSVTFYDGTSVLGTGRLAGGRATLATALLRSGSRSLKAYYAGDTNYGPSTSATLVQTINTVPGGGFQTALTYLAGGNPSSIAVGDLNGDGLADLAVADFTDGFSVLLGNGDGTFQSATHHEAGNTPYSLAIGDFNGDGRADLAVANFGSGNVSILLGNGDGTFQVAVTYVTGGTPSFIAVGDFNGDGNADLVTGNPSVNSNVSVLLGKGDGTFRAPLNSAAGAGSSYWQFVAVADLNGDGIPDLAVINGDASVNVNVLLGKGDGTFRTAGSYAAGLSAWFIAIGDFNGDGKPDLAVANAGNGTVSVLLGNGDATFQPAMNYSVEGAPHSIAIGDFNGDGKADLVTSNGGARSVSLLFGNGDGTFRTAASHLVGTNPQAVSVGDFNGDGIADLAVVSGLPLYSVPFNSADVLLGLPSSLSITVTHSGNFAPGQSGGTYTITVSTDYASSSGPVTVIDSLPSGLTATGISGTGWSCVLATLTCARSDPLAEFASYPVITLTVTVAAGGGGGVTNTVSVSGGGQMANGTSSDFTTAFTPSQAAQAWSSLVVPPSLTFATAALVMADGSVMVQQMCSSDWYRLAPDHFGGYINGTWSKAASMPVGYSPLYFSSAVLADGRLVVIGGEYNPCGVAAFTTLGAIYDPTANAWASISAPSGWTQVGDAQNTVLPDGRFLLGQPGDSQIAKLDPATLTWTILKSTAKADRNDEEGWTLLPDGTVLTVDTQVPPQSERYLPETDTWAPAGSTVALVSTGDEIGPQILRPNATVFVVGTTGHTAVYKVGAGSWAAGPDLPVSNGVQLATSDGPAVLLPSGNVLFFTSNSRSVFFFEFDGNRLNPVPSPPVGGCFAMLPLPNGQVLCSGLTSIYTPSGSPDSAWAPTIASAPNVVQLGQTYALTGTQFNGLSQAVAYGDDYQGATNYPLVRITNTATGHVFYCRTHNHSTMAVATGSAPVSTQFDVPPSIETGPSTLVVVANGIPSKPWSLTVSTTPPVSGPTIQSVVGSGLSLPAVKAISANGFFTIFGVNLAPAGTSRSVTSLDVVNGFLPTNLASTCVIAGSTFAFLTYVSPTQINAIAPALPITGSAAVSVLTNCGAPNQVNSPAANVTVAAASPEFLYWVQNANGQDPVVAVDALHGDYIGPPGLIPGLKFRAAVAGDILTIYGIGFGQTAAGPVPGALPPGADSVPSGYSVTIGGTTASASYVGVTPTDGGLYQMNVTIPAGITPGNYTIVLNVNGASTPIGGLLAIGP